MNSVILLGRLVRDPEVRFTKNQKAVASFTLAVDRGKDGADFPKVNVFGAQAESCGNFLKKGSKVCVSGSLTTGSYQNKNGDTVYTTDVSAFRVEFVDNFGKKEKEETEQDNPVSFDDVPGTYEESNDDDLPWNK